jgi:hypothetical protein
MMHRNECYPIEEGCEKEIMKNVFQFNRLCGLVVRVPSYRTEMYCASCEVWSEFIYVM